MKGTYTYEYPRPMVTVDIVLFRANVGRLETLLICRGRPPGKGLWAFPGGFVDENERLIDAAARELQEETGITGASLRQFGIFDKPDRDPRGRVITMAYCGIISRDAAEPQAGDDAAEAAWYPVYPPPALALDHSEILAEAVEWLAVRLGIQSDVPEAFQKLPAEEQAEILGILERILSR